MILVKIYLLINYPIGFKFNWERIIISIMKMTILKSKEVLYDKWESWIILFDFNIIKFIEDWMLI
jgi:hypothetical protein